ncbi:SDR family oxidoreductase [Lactobacillus johnsonii]|uniref:NAD-dependent dehydratase n=1 Tax=Lactobacillus johnsonii TaxID=33959 RepID=A0A9X0SCM8_LACJH|nr:SDR family oxidoreductase [Lactobacillus johnsonii]KXN76769.1 NAD-dependent dehydratase [Lactobacillus johnsonii]
MTKIAILGAAGQIAQLVEPMLLKKTDVDMVLYLRHPNKLHQVDESREKIIKGDASNFNELKAALAGVDLVYANLAGANIEDQAETVVKAMDANGIKRLIWVSSLGIYDEVPGKFGEWNKNILGSYLTTYRAAADKITESDLDYTIIRPAWLTNKDEVSYEKTVGAQTPFKGTEVSRLSVADYIVNIIENPAEDLKSNVGLDKPGTDGDKPAWY